MLFVGFGFLMAFLKQNGYGSIGFSYLLAAFTLQWALVVQWIFNQMRTLTFTDWKLQLTAKK